MNTIKKGAAALALALTAAAGLCIAGHTNSHPTPADPSINAMSTRDTPRGHFHRFGKGVRGPGIHGCAGPGC